jgi:lipopolysaccharide/colanic/teichoic acid biosynthesis glycosyltransferase
MNKRAFDVTTALLGLLLLSPLLLLIALWIKSDSPGPVIFRQKRVGRHALVFDIYKFRTMRPHRPGASLLTVGDDVRITRAGRFLRRYKLDKLPQLWNVIRGDMSLVGPRPELPRYVACYPPEVRTLVLSVRPGMTDWAAICFTDESAILARSPDPERAYLDAVMPARLAYNVRYVQEHGFWTDLRIILGTLAALLR